MSKPSMTEFCMMIVLAAAAIAQHAEAQSPCPQEFVEARTAAEINAAVEAQKAGCAAPTPYSRSRSLGDRSLVVVPLRLTFSRVQFDFDSSVLLPEAVPTLNALGDYFRSYGSQYRVLIEGHTDARGSDEYNQLLSERRADAVKNYLAERWGIALGALDVVGFGKRRPLPNRDPYDEVNRRVEFKLTPPQD